MGSWWQLAVVLVIVAVAAVYAGKHVWKQTRVADPDFSANTSTNCSACPSNRSEGPARDRG